jgi:subtilisin family serine protease
MNSRFVRPARTENVITVGALDPNSSIASYSNYGNNVDIFAPGSSIYSAYNGDNTSIQGMSGTSMAAPIVSGMCALYLEGDLLAEPSKVRSKIISDCSSDGQVVGLASAHTGDGVLTSKTTLYYYDYTMNVTGAITYPTSEISADRALYSPYRANSNLAASKLVFNNGSYKRA